MKSIREDDLVKTVIKQRVETLYLVNDRDLDSLKTNSIAADILILIASISLGTFFSGNSRIFLVVGLLALLMALFFYYLKIDFIRDTKKSGEVEEIKKAKLTEFNIIKATYGTTSENTIDITERLKRQIKDNRLNVATTNEIAGSDPDPGTVKYLEIEYEYGGTTVTKKYREMENIDIP